jgi:hypothetical protein
MLIHLQIIQIMILILRKLLRNGFVNNNIREIVTTGFNVTVSEGQDYSKLENARKLNQNEYTIMRSRVYIIATTIS